jgi:hypothetical protein
LVVDLKKKNKMMCTLGALMLLSLLNLAISSTADDGIIEPHSLGRAEAKRKVNCLPSG